MPRITRSSLFECDAPPNPVWAEPAGRTPVATPTPDPLPAVDPAAPADAPVLPVTPEPVAPAAAPVLLVPPAPDDAAPPGDVGTVVVVGVAASKVLVKAVVQGHGAPPAVR